jgi:hypothetical protein
MTSFLGKYDNALSSYECEILIKQFEESPQLEGHISKDGKSVLDPSVKKCRQLNQPRLSDKSIISNTILPHLISCLEKYKKSYLALDYIEPGTFDDAFSFQKYETEEDGFHSWHSEAGGRLTSNRILAWMIYLNNAKSGTEFMDFPTVRAKMGRCIIWPAAFTHVHRSEPNKGLKYVISGWISFMEQNT